MLAGLVLSVLAAATAGEGAPDLIAVQVGLVRVTPFRPGTQTTWAIPGQKVHHDPCGLLVPMATAAATGVTLGAGLAGHGIIKSLCTDIFDNGSAAQTHIDSDPDIYVRLGSDQMSFRSYTVRKTRTHRFKFRVVMPAAAIPKAGLVVDVVDDDGSDNEDSKEVIGSVRLSPDQLLQAATSGTPIVAKDNGVDKIEIIVSPATLPKQTKAVTMDVKKGLVSVGDDFDVAAGEVVEVQANGAYDLARHAQPITPAGFAGNAQLNYPDEPFKSGPTGAAIVRAGKHRLMKGFLAAPCVSFIAPFEAHLAVGVNYAHLEKVRGDLSFNIVARPATAEEWQAGSAAACKPEETTAVLKEEAADYSSRATAAAEKLRGLGNGLAAAILKRIHPTGRNATLRAVEARGTAAGVSVAIALDWQGGFLGKRYTTVVVWDFNERRHIASRVARDTAMINISPKAADAMNRYLASELYPAVQ